MRGTDGWLKCSSRTRRITPACAGNRDISRHGLRARWDHPRVCGEQALVKYICVVVIGSPPRVRGTASQQSKQAQISRITPACAGNSHPFSASEKQKEDHPRVCGEQDIEGNDGGYVLGSPPRVRGTDEVHAFENYDNRITPACAGNRFHMIVMTLME